jgi:stage V sporulation protein D (sporulation-specific penicillin-binding protein)
MAILIVRLADLQIIQNEYFLGVAESQRLRASELSPHRGAIYMAESNQSGSDDIFPVASNQRAWVAYAVPREMDEPFQIAEKLAPRLLAFRQRQQQLIRDIITSSGQLINQATESPTPSPEPDESHSKSNDEQLAIVLQELNDKFNQANDPYEPILKPYEILDQEFYTYLQEENLEGIHLEEQEIRVYPEKTLAAHVLGYVGYEDTGRVGRYGIEGYWQKQLAGNLGFLSAERDNSGRFIGVSDREFKPAYNGDDIVLTIDRVVQSIIEEELKKGVEKYGAERGSIIAMDPRTGAILGMATYPTFDPNFYYSINDARVQSNPVISDIFEPGSILKPVIMGAAIEEGLVSPDTTMVDNGPVKVADRVINTFDGKHSGVTTMTQVLENSNNIGMVWVGQQLGAEKIYDYFRRFGLGEKTGIRLEGETNTNLPSPDDWNVTTVATSSFGQGIALTPLQALNSINVFANGGTLMQPYIIDEIRKQDGSVEQNTPIAVRQVITPETSQKLSAMMVSVIENGVAGLARVPGYYLAGKTGTAQVPDERGKYSPDRKIISFVGYGPVEQPRLSLLIKLDNPAGLSFASGTAAPMFRDIMQRLLQYYQIPPSYDVNIPQSKYKASPNG